MDPLTRVNTSFLCGSRDSGTPCLERHPSCATFDIDGLCETCTAAEASKTADGAMCLCNSGSADSKSFHTACGPCHGDCTTCGVSNFKYSCHTCSIAGATLPPYISIGGCECRAGYVPDDAPTAACIHCAPAGCPYCIGSDESECMSQEQADFAKNLITAALALPLLTESADNLICYRTPLLTAGCTPDPIEAVTGTIIDYETVAKPTVYQCYELLKAEWPFITYWFDQLFPTFTGPVPNSYANMLFIKTTLQIWILHFGPAEMNTWTDIKAVMNDAGENWKNHMAWIDSNPGFSMDAGTTVKAFPAKLLAWLQSSCSSTTASCFELMATFSMWSGVCADASCSSSVKAYCAQISPTGPCASS